MAHSESHLYVLTAAHVVGRSESVGCEFWKDGLLRKSVRGLVLLTAEHEDIAILAISLADFGSHIPTPIPLSSRHRSLRTGEPISSVGHAGGNWGTSWVGHVTGAIGQRIHFQPPPAGGRSGSAIFDRDGKEILGMIAARNNISGEGIAVSVIAVHDVLERAKRSNMGEATGNCVPMLGRLQPNPVPNSDLNETNRKLDAIADLLRQLHQQNGVPETPEATEAQRLSLLQAATTLHDLRNNGVVGMESGAVGVTMAQLLCGALGISGPIGLGIGAAGWLVSRRLGRRLRARLGDGTEESVRLETRLVQAITDRLSGRIHELFSKKEG